MKKTLLAFASLALALGANAAGFDDNLTALYNGEQITDGCTVLITDYEDYEIYFPGLGYEYQAYIEIVNNTAENIKTGFKASYTDHPTQEMALADREAWGGLQLCVEGAVEGDNCLQVLEMERTVKANGSLTWRFDNTSVSPTKGEKDRTYHIELTGEDTTLSFDVIFNPSDGKQGISYPEPVGPATPGFDGNLTAMYNGEPINNGDVLKISDYEDYEIYFPGMGYEYQAYIEIVNNTDENIKTGFKASYTDHPTQEMALADREAWGGLQLCVEGAVEGDNCLQVLEMERTVKANGSLTWRFDNTSVSPTKGEKNRTYHIELTGEDTVLEFDVVFNPDTNPTGVASVYDGDESPVYYNLQGQRVLNPEKGLYVVKHNGKTSKVVIR